MQFLTKANLDQTSTAVSLRMMIAGIKKKIATTTLDFAIHLSDFVGQNSFVFHLSPVTVSLCECTPLLTHPFSNPSTLLRLGPRNAVVNSAFLTIIHYMVCYRFAGRKSGGNRLNV